MINSNSILLKTSKSLFDEKLNGFLIGFEGIIQHFKATEGKYFSRDITYAQFLARMEQLDREIISYIDEVTFEKDNYAKKMISNFIPEYRSLVNMLTATEGVIFKGYKYTNEQISHEIILCSELKYNSILQIRDYVRACDLVIFTGIEQIYNVPEIDSLSIEDATYLILNRLYRIRDNENYFPLNSLLKGNGIVFKRNGTYQYIAENLQQEGLLDVKEKGKEYFVRISLNGIHEIEKRKKILNNKKHLTDKFTEIKNSIPINGVLISIEQIKSILIDPNSENYNTLLLIERRYREIRERETKGILRDETIITEFNKITYSLMSYMDDIIQGKVTN
jgi:hypothetical protein